MTLIHGFIQEGLFYDDVNFPRGFRKSGDFNISESELLTELGTRLTSLESGKGEPQNETEQAFVTMCKEQTPGNTRIEILWQKYKKMTTYRPFHSLNGSAQVQEASSASVESNEEVDDSLHVEDE